MVHMLFQKHVATCCHWWEKSVQWPRTLQYKPFALQNDTFDYMQNIIPTFPHILDTNLWFSSLSAGVMVFFCFRCSITAFCFITTWNTRRRQFVRTKHMFNNRKDIYSVRGSGHTEAKRVATKCINTKYKHLDLIQQPFVTLVMFNVHYKYL